MIVVADTSPINYLILIEAIEILPELYQTVFVPEAVFDELQAAETPEKVRDWIKTPPVWFDVKKGAILLDSDLSELDKGEREAIALVEELEQICVECKAGC
jgi:predicted nucleic acid-binding protein